MMANAITIHIGDDEAFTMAVSDANGNPVADLSGYSFACQPRASAGAATPLMDLSTDNGKITRGAGQITITVGHADSTGITITSGVGDVKVTDPLGKIRHTDLFAITFAPRVTQ